MSRIVVLLLLMGMVVPLSAQEPAIQGRTATEWAEMLANEENPRRRQAAVLALGLIGTKSPLVEPALLRALQNDPEELVRRRVVATLGRLKVEEPARIVRVLAETLKSDDSPAVRADCASALGRLDEAALPALGALRSALKDKDAPTRAAAAEAIGRLGLEASTAVDDLAPLLEDDEDTVRLYGVYALGRVGPDAAKFASSIGDRLREDTSPDVRRAAARSLGLLGPPAASQAMRLGEALLQDKAEAVRQEAVLALTKMGDAAKSADESLRRALKEDEDKSVRTFAARAVVVCLGEDSQQAVEPLVEALKSEKVGEVRVAIIEELGSLGPTAVAAIPMLKEAQRDVQKAVRDAAARALEKIRTTPKKDKP